ncbi:hypothetical protein JCM10207_008397 [Rhodosporidiobolus poonsookiae]
MAGSETPPLPPHRIKLLQLDPRRGRSGSRSGSEEEGEEGEEDEREEGELEPEPGEVDPRGRAMSVDRRQEQEQVQERGEETDDYEEGELKSSSPAAPRSPPRERRATPTPPPPPPPAQERRRSPSPAPAAAPVDEVEEGEVEMEEGEVGGLTPPRPSEREKEEEERLRSPLGAAAAVESVEAVKPDGGEGEGEGDVEMRVEPAPAPAPEEGEEAEASTPPPRVAPLPLPLPFAKAEAEERELSAPSPAPAPVQASPPPALQPAPSASTSPKLSRRPLPPPPPPYLPADTAAAPSSSAAATEPAPAPVAAQPSPPAPTLTSEPAPVSTPLPTPAPPAPARKRVVPPPPPPFVSPPAPAAAAAAEPTPAPAPAAAAGGKPETVLEEKAQTPVGELAEEERNEVEVEAPEMEGVQPPQPVEEPSVAAAAPDADAEMASVEQPAEHPVPSPPRPAQEAQLPTPVADKEMAVDEGPLPRSPSPVPVPSRHEPIQQNHSPTTPQERRSPTPPLSPLGAPAKPDAMDEDEPSPRRALVDRAELFGATWDTFDEPHQRLSAALFESFSERDDERRLKALALRQQYKALHGDWKAHVKRLDQIRDRVHRRQTGQHGGGFGGSTAPPTPSIDSAGMPFYPEPSTPGPSLTGGRANRRSAGASAAFGYGDAVRSEAEFLEILASLETADLRDPDVRAARTAAVVPDMMLTPREARETILPRACDDEQRRVDDPVAAYGIDAPLDVWTEQEVETFCKRYAQHPKQFGKIAHDLPAKSTAQCVLFYYRMKNTIDFRSLSDRRGRDGRRKKAKKRPEEARGGKGASLLSNLKRPKTVDKGSRGKPTDDDDEGEDDAPPSPKASRSALPPIAESPAFSPAAPRAPPLPALDFADPALASHTHLVPPTPLPAVAVSTPAAALPASPPKKTPKSSHAPLPPSEGMMEAAEVLGALGVGASDPPAVDEPAPAAAEEGKRVQRAAARKVRMDLDDEIDPLLGVLDDGPRAHPLDSSLELQANPGLGGAGLGDKAKPKRRSNTSSYWTVAERGEILRLLSVHGKDWKKVAEGLGNKTWIQCRNWYQNNAKKHNLNDIVNSGPLDDDLDSEMASPGHASFLSGTPLQENMAIRPNHVPRSGFFDAPDPQLLPPLPSLDVAASRPGSSGKAGMHIRNMLNDDGPDESVASPARDDWFGGDAASVTTEDDVEAVAGAAFPEPRVAQEIPRPSSVPYGAESATARFSNGLPSLFRSAPALPSFPTTLSDRRYDSASRLASLNGHSAQQWSGRASLSPYPSFPSPASAASPVTPGAHASADYYRRPYETAPVASAARPPLPDYFAAKANERAYPPGPASTAAYPAYRTPSQPLSAAQYPPHWPQPHGRPSL